MSQSETENIIAAVELLEWRDRELVAVHDQLTEAFPKLLDRIRETLDLVSSLKMATALATGQHNLPKPVRSLFDDWAAAEGRIALERADAHLDETIERLEALAVVPSGGVDIATITSLAAGAGLIGASIAAIPALVATATVTTTSFFVFTSTAVAWPVVAVGGAGLAAATYFGGAFVDRGEARLRRRYAARIEDELSWRVFGREPQDRSLLNDLQAAIIARSDARLRNA